MVHLNWLLKKEFTNTTDRANPSKQTNATNFSIALSRSRTEFHSQQVFIKIGHGPDPIISIQIRTLGSVYKPPYFVGNLIKRGRMMGQIGQGRRLEKVGGAGVP